MIPGWTLNYEMMVYILFACALFAPTRLRVGVTLGVLCALAVFGMHRPLSGAALFYTNPIILEFGAGLLIAAPVPFQRVICTTDALDKHFLCPSFPAEEHGATAPGSMVQPRGRPRDEERGRGCDTRRVAFTIAPPLWRPRTRVASEP